MDQGMAAKILRIATSSFYGLPAKVKTVRQAVLVLGFDTARALAVASKVIDHFGGVVSEVAAFFAKDRKQVYRWMRRHGIDVAEVRDPSGGDDAGSD